MWALLVKALAWVVLVALAAQPLHVTRGTVAGTTFYYHGSIQNVINGAVPQNLTTTAVDPASVYFGFSVGTPDQLDSMGNMIVVNGLAFTRDTNPQDSNYFKVRSSTVPIRSTSSVYILKEQPETLTIDFDDANIEYTNVTSSLFELMNGRPHCYYGLGTFARLEGVALSKSPIYGQNIFKYKNEYFSQPPLNATGSVPVALMGCAADLVTMSPGPLKTNLERVLYFNPFGVASNITVHVEVMQLTQPVTSLADIKEGMGVSVDHMLSQSVLESLHIKVFEVADLQPLRT